MYVGFVVVFGVFCCLVAAAVALTLGCLSRNENFVACPALVVGTESGQVTDFY